MPGSDGASPCRPAAQFKLNRHIFQCFSRPVDHVLSVRARPLGHPTAADDSLRSFQQLRPWPRSSQRLMLAGAYSTASLLSAPWLRSLRRQSAALRGRALRVAGIHHLGLRTSWPALCCTRPGEDRNFRRSLRSRWRGRNALAPGPSPIGHHAPLIWAAKRALRA